MTFLHLHVWYASLSPFMKLFQLSGYYCLEKNLLLCWLTGNASSLAICSRLYKSAYSSSTDLFAFFRYFFPNVIPRIFLPARFSIIFHCRQLILKEVIWKLDKYGLVDTIPRRGYHTPFYICLKLWRLNK